MSSIKEIIEHESSMFQGGERGVIHLHREGSFFRAYDWSAFLACRYLHEFKVNKRTFSGIELSIWIEQWDGCNTPPLKWERSG